MLPCFQAANGGLKRRKSYKHVLVSQRSPQLHHTLGDAGKYEKRPDWLPTQAFHRRLWPPSSRRNVFLRTMLIDWGYNGGERANTNEKQRPRGDSPDPLEHRVPTPTSGVLASTAEFAHKSHRQEQPHTWSRRMGASSQEGPAQRKPMCYLHLPNGYPMPRFSPVLTGQKSASSILRRPNYHSPKAHIRKELAPLLIKQHFSSSLLPGAQLSSCEYTASVLTNVFLQHHFDGSMVSQDTAIYSVKPTKLCF